MATEATWVRSALVTVASMISAHPSSAAAGTDAGPPVPLLQQVAAWARTWSPRQWALLDVALAVVSFVGLTLPVLLGVPEDEPHAVAVVALGAATTLPLAVRRRWPGPVLLVIVVALTASLALGVRTTPFVSNAGPGVALAVYTAVERSATQDRRLWILGCTCMAIGVGYLLGLWLQPDYEHNAFHSIAAVAAWWVGDNVRAQREYRAALAERQRREQAEGARLAAAEERLRLSREVHDVVSHSLSVIAVRSGVARMVADERPDEARAALAAIETASRGALDELRRLLSTTRDPGREGDADGAVPPDLAPAASLADIPALVDRMAASGLDVTLHQHGGPPEGLSPTLGLSAYRVVQEGLTNVVRHAPGARAEVTLTATPAGVVVEVVDDGGPGGAGPAGAPDPAANVAVGGFGLVGVRERAALFGGSVAAGPLPGGGFRLRADLPSGAPAAVPVPVVVPARVTGAEAGRPGGDEHTDGGAEEP
jgi:signal transduction histidine kinase